MKTALVILAAGIGAAFPMALVNAIVDRKAQTRILLGLTLLDGPQLVLTAAQNAEPIVGLIQHGAEQIL